MSNDQQALLCTALEYLRSNAAEVFPLAVIRSIMGEPWLDRVKERRREYVDANKASGDPASMLSATAHDWWTEARHTLAYGRMVFSGLGRSHELALSRKCEKLDVSFPARVPVPERGMFKFHDLLDGAGWDERWHNCVDHNFPLLRLDLANGPVVANTMREAQISILEEALVPPIARATSSALMSAMRSLVRD